MNYRAAKPEDLESVIAFCAKHDLSVSLNSTIWLAEHEGEIKAVIAARPVMFIEPLAADNPVAGLNLVDKMEELIKKIHVPVIRVICKPERKELFGKAGYHQVFENNIVMEKVLIGDK